MVRVVLNVPAQSVVADLTDGVLPKSIFTTSYNPYPVPLIVTTVPTVAEFGVTKTICGRIKNLFSAICWVLTPFALIVFVP